MSQFEFLRSIPIGQYLPIDSMVHRLDPRARLLAAVILLLVLTFCTTLSGLLIGLTFVILALVLARIPLRFALRGLLTPLPFLLIIALLQVFWNANPDQAPFLLEWGFIRVTITDVMLGIKLLLRFCGLILGLGLVSYTTTTSQLTQGLNGLLKPLHWLRIPTDDFVMMVQVTLRFLPLLAQTTERIAMAQASRGADWEARTRNLVTRIRQIIPILLPLFITSLNRATNMAMAMDARGYGAQQRTSMMAFKMRAPDWLSLLATGLVSLIMLLTMFL